MYFFHNVKTSPELEAELGTCSFLVFYVVNLAKKQGIYIVILSGSTLFYSLTYYNKYLQVKTTNIKTSNLFCKCPALYILAKFKS